MDIFHKKKVIGMKRCTIEEIKEETKKGIKCIASLSRNL